MFDMWKDFSFKKLGVPMKGLFILIIITVVIWVTLMLWNVVDPEGMGNFFWGKYEPQIIDSPVEEESLIAPEGLTFPSGYLMEWEPPRFVMLLPFEIDFQDEETGDFLGTLEIRNVKNKRVQIFWNGLATSIVFPIGKENKKRRLNNE